MGAVAATPGWGTEPEMDDKRGQIAEEILASSRTHDAAEPDRRARFRNVEPETAALLGVLVRCVRARAILELGTSNGYSTIWLADAADATGGIVTSIELDPTRTAMARENLARVGLTAELRTEDAAVTLRGSRDDSWDFIFLDAERPAYADYWSDLLRVLRPGGGLLAIDNVLSHASEVAKVATLIEAERSVETTIVPIGAGLRLVVRS
jgi:predicted O-methyltransferase YrrM